MIFYIVGALIGFAVLIGGVYYLIKEKNDKESRNIYTAASAIGGLIMIIMIIMIITQTR